MKNDDTRSVSSVGPSTHSLSCKNNNNSWYKSTTKRLKLKVKNTINLIMILLSLIYIRLTTTSSAAFQDRGHRSVHSTSKTIRTWFGSLLAEDIAANKYMRDLLIFGVSDSSMHSKLFCVIKEACSQLVRRRFSFLLLLFMCIYSRQVVTFFGWDSKGSGMVRSVGNCYSTLMWWSIWWQIHAELSRSKPSLFKRVGVEIIIFVF